MSDSDSSELSSVPSEDESIGLTKKNGILKFFTKAKTAPVVEIPPKSPPRPKRDPSPPHEYVLADNPDIAFIVMYRSRFNDAFAKSLPNFGPQELERGVVDTIPSEQVEQFLCAVLGLLLNRKQDVKPGHYNRALEEAVQTHKSQWAKDWDAKNPLSGGATFTSMSPTERLTLLKTLVLWSLSSSDVIKGIIQTAYKSTRQEDDLKVPLSVQPWGSDADKRRYYLIEGLDDTHFRVYRESNHTGIKRTWWSVASDIDELKALAEKLEKEDGGQKARLLSSKMLAAVPRFEETEEKRKRREYRLMRKQQFRRPEPNYSMYEGRTRGKRIKYTYSDGEEEDTGYSDATTNRRSTRNTRNHTPAEGFVPTVTQSGRQVKARHGGAYGESMLSGTTAPDITTEGFNETSEEPEDSSGGRPRRAAAAKVTNGYSARKGGAHIEGYNSIDEYDSDEDDASEQDYGDDEEEEEEVPLESDNEEPDHYSEDEEISDDEKKSLLVKLPVKTLTPEKKTTIKLRISPETLKRDKPASVPPPEVDVPAKAISHNPLDSVPDSPPKSASPTPMAKPHSPLTFRGSPGKQCAFPVPPPVSASGT
ncbi:hypothetical protein B0O99DRAFT_502947 [Bisporella sp. PMI_857]|nr:hypothetical protein B0O99DRAFT_502947 [Bisporella sp. PMI_857]